MMKNCVKIHICEIVKKTEKQKNRKTKIKLSVNENINEENNFLRKQNERNKKIRVFVSI